MAIQLKRSLTTNISSTYVLQQGQIGIEMPASKNTQTNPFKFKIGDGSTQWKDLPYAGLSSQNTIGTIQINYDSANDCLVIS